MNLYIKKCWDRGPGRKKKNKSDNELLDEIEFLEDKIIYLEKEIKSLTELKVKNANNLYSKSVILPFDYSIYPSQLNID